MPTVSVYYPDGSEWLVSHCEIIIPAWTISTLTPQQIGERVIQLLPHVQHIEKHRDDWPFPTPDTLEELEQHFEIREQNRVLRQQLRERAKKLRKEMRKNYEELSAQLVERDGYCCRRCDITSCLHIDHVIALMNGGTNDLENLQFLCQSCNSKKLDKE